MHFNTPLTTFHKSALIKDIPSCSSFAVQIFTGEKMGNMLRIKLYSDILCISSVFVIKIVF